MEIRCFILEGCPYCIRAKKIFNEIKDDSRFKDITIEWLDERKYASIANSLDYYLVPTFYLKDKKLFEGIIDKNRMIQLLEEVKETCGTC